MSRHIGCEYDFQRLPNEQESDIILRVQTYCADLASEGGDWTEADGIALGKMFNEAEHPFDLFRFVDEKTGHFTVGYRTRDGREWFHILRQMRNQVGSGLLETMMGPFDHHTADGRPMVRTDGPETAEGGLIGQQPY